MMRRLPEYKQAAPRLPRGGFMSALLVLCAFAACMVVNPASAQSGYPNRPVRLVVPFPPGGLSDSLARLYGRELSERLGQPFVIESKPGAAAATVNIIIRLPGYAIGTTWRFAHAQAPRRGVRIPSSVWRP